MAVQILPTNEVTSTLLLIFK